MPWAFRTLEHRGSSLSGAPLLNRYVSFPSFKNNERINDVIFYRFLVRYVSSFIRALTFLRNTHKLNTRIKGILN